MGFGPGLTKTIGENGYGIVQELVIGSADVDCKALTKTGGPLVGFRVLSGSGIFAYVDDVTGATKQIGDQVALAANDEIAPIAVRTILGTGSSPASGALTIRGRW